ncbi:hypothetical protein [Streptomyces adustus]
MSAAICDSTPVQQEAERRAQGDESADVESTQGRGSSQDQRMYDQYPAPVGAGQVK